MQLPFCKICGEHHRLGHCPLWDTPPEVKHETKPAGAAQTDQHHQAEKSQGQHAQEDPWQQSWLQARQLSPEDMKQESMSVIKPRFDRNAYQRDLMRKRRAAQKAAKNE